MVELDNLDREILYELRVDARERKLYGEEDG